MKKIVMPKMAVSYYDKGIAEFVECGEIIAVEMIDTPVNTSLADTPVRYKTTYSDIHVTERGMMKRLYPGTDREGWLISGYLSGTYDRYIGQIVTHVIPPFVSVKIKLTKNIASNQRVVFYGFVKVKRIIKPVLDVTINDIENVQLALTATTQTNISTYEAMQQLPQYGENDATATAVYVDPVGVNGDSFITWDVPLKLEDMYAHERARIKLFADEKTNTVYSTSYASIAKAYRDAGGVLPANHTKVRLRFRGFKGKPVIGDASQLTLKDPNIIYNYPVGVITKVKDFKVSADGFTISGRFNGKCTVEYRFNNGLPTTFNTDADGAFSYTASTTHLGGGTLTLRPSNVVGTYTASTIVLADRIAPLAATDITVTKEGMYAVGEVGATVKLYTEERVFIGQTTIAINGIVKIEFPTPIANDVVEQNFIYTIEDSAGNVSPEYLITYSGQVEAVTGPLYEVDNDIIRPLPGVSKFLTITT